MSKNVRDVTHTLSDDKYEILMRLYEKTIPENQLPDWFYDKATVRIIEARESQYKLRGVVLIRAPLGENEFFRKIDSSDYMWRHIVDAATGYESILIHENYYEYVLFELLCNLKDGTANLKSMIDLSQFDASKAADIE
jgi:hypothetical protein